MRAAALDSLRRPPIPRLNPHEAANGNGRNPKNAVSSGTKYRDRVGEAERVRRHSFLTVALVTAGLGVFGGLALQSSRDGSGPSVADARQHASRSPQATTVPADSTFGIPQGGAITPPPVSVKVKADSEQTRVVLAVLAKDPSLDAVAIPDLHTLSAAAAVYPLTGALFEAIVPLAAPQELNSVVPVYVGAAFGIDPPEVRNARLVATNVSALDVWVDVEKGSVVQIDQGGGTPVSFEWIGKPPPKIPGD